MKKASISAWFVVMNVVAPSSSRLVSSGTGVLMCIVHGGSCCKIVFAHVFSGKIRLWPIAILLVAVLIWAFPTVSGSFVVVSTASSVLLESVSFRHSRLMAGMSSVNIVLS